MPIELPAEDIEALRTGLAHGICAEPHPYLTQGQRVRLRHGPLADMQGILLRRKGKFRVVISIDLIQRAVAVEADEMDVESVEGRKEAGLTLCHKQQDLRSSWGPESVHE
jgi:hypothetical protein